MEIIIFGIIAGVLIARLNSVLGQKNDGDELRGSGNLARDNQSQDGQGADGNVIPMPGRADMGPPNELDDDMPISVAAQIERVQRIDGNFDEDHFNEGAKAAFPMIVEAFAAGEKEVLRDLLDDGIYQDFAAAIDDRAQSGETMTTEIKAVHDVSVLEAKIKDRMIEVTVRIISDQVNELTRKQAANEGSGVEPATVEITDIWTFARPVGSDVPNWKLIETSVDT
ncbi:MAG: Tim44 domain-containing protein [Alphaproteobacteria bacterium]|nr:Tim44 domain-containing protein [Alphaproteobacteria bacterium SS10]